MLCSARPQRSAAADNTYRVARLCKDAIVLSRLRFVAFSNFDCVLCYYSTYRIVLYRKGSFFFFYSRLPILFEATQQKPKTPHTTTMDMEASPAPAPTTDVAATTTTTNTTTNNNLQILTCSDLPRSV